MTNLSAVPSTVLVPLSVFSCPELMFLVVVEAQTPFYAILLPPVVMYLSETWPLSSLLSVSPRDYIQCIKQTRAFDYLKYSDRHVSEV